MKKLLYLALFLICIACKAQTVAFNTSLDDIPDGAYVKDLNNELDPFIGEYKVTYEGRETTLFISKFLKSQSRMEIKITFKMF